MKEIFELDITTLSIHDEALATPRMLEVQYEALKAEDRVKWLYVLPTNQYNITKLAFPDKIPDEFIGIKSVLAINRLI